MNEYEYKFIRNLAWDLLIDANISQLPVDINAVAALYNLQHLIDNSKTLYENTLSVSKGILKLFGMDDKDFIKPLAVRILSPLIVFKELGVTSVEDICELSGLPKNVANQRFKRFEMLLQRNSFKVSRLETIVLSQFLEWINNR